MLQIILRGELLSRHLEQQLQVLQGVLKAVANLRPSPVGYRARVIWALPKQQLPQCPFSAAAAAKFSRSSSLSHPFQRRSCRLKQLLCLQTQLEQK